MGATQQFTATENDQFGNALTTQPTWTWSVVAGDGVISNGLYTPPDESGSATVQAVGGAQAVTAGVTYLWQAQWNSGNGGSWNTSGDWVNNITQTVIAAPGVRGIAGDTVLFSSTTGSAITLDGANPSLAGLTFSSGSNGYTVGPGTGGTLDLDNGGNSASIAVSAGNQTISAPVGLVSSVVVTPAASSQLTISGGISGAGSSLTMNGGGTLILSGTNNFTGGVSVTSGTLVAASAGAIPSGGSLVVGAGASLLFGPTLTGAPAVITNSSVDAALSAGPVSAARAGYLRSGWACGWRIDSTSVHGVQAATKPVTPVLAVTSAALFTSHASPTQTLLLKTTKLEPSIVTTSPAPGSQTKAHDAVLQFWYMNNSAYGPKEPVQTSWRLP